METILAIQTRRSIRSFKKKSVSDKKIRKILECALSAPSSKNSNPWYFLVVRGKKKDKIAKELINIVEVRKTTKETMPIDSMTGKAVKGLTDTTIISAKAILEASALILIFNRAPFTKGAGLLAEAIKKGKRVSLLYTYAMEIIGLGAAIQNMSLAAHDLGLGAVFVGDIYPAKGVIKKIFKIKYDLVGAIVFGWPTYRPPPRKIKQGLVKFIK